MSDADIVHAWVYRCTRKAETYLFLAKADAPDAMPDGLRELVGPIELVMELDIHAERKLAHADPVRVMQDLRSQGYYLQLPPTRMPFAGPSTAAH